MKSKNIIGSILIIVTTVILVMVFIMLMAGRTETFGKNPTNIQGKSLFCESFNTTYPFFEYDNSKSKNLRIMMSFYDDKLDAITLTYTLYYNNEEQATASEAYNHAAMNINFSKDDLNADAYNAHYSKIDNTMRMELYIASNNINDTAMKYLMLETNNYSTFPTTPSEYQAFYEIKGLTCVADNK